MDCSAAGLLLVVVAILLGFLYQRYVFRPAGGEETGA
jgi:hypothetical protein